MDERLSPMQGSAREADNVAWMRAAAILQRDSPSAYRAGALRLFAAIRVLDRKVVGGTIAQDEFDAVEVEVVRFLFRNIPFTFTADAVGVFAVVVALWAHTDHASLLLWIACVLVWFTPPLWPIAPKKLDATPAAFVPLYGYVYVVTAFIVGATIGLGAACFYAPGVVVTQLTVIALVGLFTAGTLAFNGPYFPAIAAFHIALNAPVIARFAWIAWAGSSDVGFHAGLALGLLSFLAICLFSGASLGRLAARNIVLRRRNERMADTLNVLNQDLEQANHELEAKQREAELASLAKSRFLAAASHDLRQPLHALGLFVKAMEEKIMTPEVSALVRNIRAASDSMSNLFNAYLDLTRLDTGSLSPQLTRFPLRPLIDSIAAQLVLEAHDKRLELRIRGPDVSVESDHMMLDRILRNLASNAVRYTHRGGVLIAWKRRGDRVRIDVVDTGIGISAEEQGAVFDAFYQIERDRVGRHRGIGLGLAIARGFADLLGCELTLQSAPGRGSRFRLEVPYAVATGADVQPVQGSNSAHTDLDGMLVMIVDDDDQVVRATRELLVGWNALVVSARNGNEALRQIETMDRLPDVVLCDLQLGEEENGWQLAQRARRLPELAAIRWIIITGTFDLAQPPDRTLTVLRKPLSPDALSRVLSDAVRSPPAQ